MADVIHAVRPDWVIVENVPELVADEEAFSWLLEDLAGLGFDGEWGVVSACSLGAPHVRRRLFVVAYSGRVARSLVGQRLVWPSELSGTGLTVAEHQARTVDNYLELRHLAPDLPFVPVLQGWERDDYLRCVDLYGRRGVDLIGAQAVGLGSVCRRQSTGEIAMVVGALAPLGLPLHGFGVKTNGLRSYSAYLASADSLAWSYDGRHTHPCAHGQAQSEANCPTFADAWRSKVVASFRYSQLDLLAEVG